MQCWSEAEEVAKNMPMFKNGAKAFWQMACNTINEENTVRLGGWNNEKTNDGMSIEWLGDKGQSLGKQNYILSTIIPKGLEAKENFLFEATDAPEGWAFRYLLVMPPMPARDAKNHGGLLSHLHFQYASNLEMLLKYDALCKPMLYATMCDVEGTLSERCNVIRALHRLPIWTKL